MIDNTYQPSDVEGRIYAAWRRRAPFRGRSCPERRGGRVPIACLSIASGPAVRRPAATARGPRVSDATPRVCSVFDDRLSTRRLFMSPSDSALATIPFSLHSLQYLPCSQGHLNVGVPQVFRQHFNHYPGAYSLGYLSAHDLRCSVLASSPLFIPGCLGASVSGLMARGTARRALAPGTDHPVIAPPDGGLGRQLCSTAAQST